MIEVNEQGYANNAYDEKVNVKWYEDNYTGCEVINIEKSNDDEIVSFKLKLNFSNKDNTIQESIETWMDIIDEYDDDVRFEWNEFMFSMFSNRDIILAYLTEQVSNIYVDACEKCMDYLSGR